MKKEVETKLHQSLGLFSATTAGVGVIVGAGVYVLIGLASGVTGNSVWLSFLISAIVAGFTGFSYAELSSMFSKDSGELYFVKRALGNKLGFLAAYSILLAGVASTTTVALGFAGYLTKLIGPVSLWIPAAILIVLFALVNIVGIKHTSTMNIVFTAVEVFGLLWIVLMALGYVGNVNYLEMPNGFTGLFNSAALIFFAYIGFEGVIKLAEETKGAKKIIPKALLLSLIISTIIYILVAIAAVSVVDWQTLGQSNAPLADVANALMGSGAGLILTLIALASTGNTVLLDLLISSRTLYGFGEEVKRLKILKKVNPLTKTPIIATLIATAICLVLLLIKKIDVVAEVANFSIFVAFALVNLSVIILRYKIPKQKRYFRSPLNIGNFSVMGLLGFITSLFMILNLQLIVILGGVGLTTIGVTLATIFER